MPIATLSTHARVTIPLEIRGGLRLKPQDVLTFTLLKVARPN
jgi:bifunctional DNA-binding transcriptional regulator/antitoxin component of YhaV-PrlF toxin-antitoxin module